MNNYSQSLSYNLSSTILKQSINYLNFPIYRSLTECPICTYIVCERRIILVFTDRYTYEIRQTAHTLKIHKNTQCKNNTQEYPKYTSYN